MFILRTLGGAQVEGPSGPLNGKAAYRRRIALLALLASPPAGSLTREKIIGYLWPENDSDRARHLLSVSLHVLRRELGEGAFLARGDELALNPEVVSSDVAGFEAAVRAGNAERAVALYRGPFLDGFYVSDAPPFDHWVERERERLARLYADALERLAEAAEASGDAAEAASWWQLLGAHDPYSSRVALRLMRALDAAGDRVSAVRYAAAHATALRDDLGIDPDPQVAALAALLRTSPEPALPPEGSAPTGGPVHPPEPEPAPEPGPSPPGVPANDAAARPPRRRLAWLAALVPGVLALAAVVPYLHPPGATDAAESRAGLERIAVLYFEDQSERQDLGYLASDLTENLIHQLARVEGLRVISPNGVKPYRNRVVPTDSIRRSLEVGTLLTGRLTRSGDSLRLSVYLVDANSDEVLEGEVLQRPVGERFALGDDLAEEVAQFLRVRLGKEVRLRQWAAGTRSTRARELLSRAEEMRENGLEVAGRPDAVAVLTARRMLDIADSMLAQATVHDPEWVEPFVRRGRLALDRVRVTAGQDDSVWTQRALAHAARALELEPGYPPALEVRGAARWHQAYTSPSPDSQRALVAEARADLRAATTADPSLASAWSTLSEVLRFDVNPVEAEYAARQAYEKDAYLSDADDVLERLYRIALMLERPDEAARWCGTGRRRFPADWRFVECELLILSHPSHPDPDPAKAWRLFRRISEMDPPEKARLTGRGYQQIHRQMKVATVLARAGDEERARAILARARAEAASDSQAALSLMYDEACLLLLLGEKERALQLIRTYLRARPGLQSYMLRDPNLRGLWSDPRFRARVAAP